MSPQTPTDGFAPGWRSFAHFFLDRDDLQSTFLIELDHDSGTRVVWPVLDWQRRVVATTKWLDEQHVVTGTAVATIAGNTADALALAYACWLGGACCVPLNPADPADRLAYIVRDAGATLIVTSESLSHIAEALSVETGVTLVSTDCLPLRYPAEQDAASALDEGSWSLDIGLDGPALRVYTSGTTGEPKGVLLTPANLLTQCDALMAGTGWGAGETILTVLPIHHVNGLAISSLLPWYARHTTILCDRFRSERFWLDAAAEQVSVCSVVPSLLEFLLSGPGSAPPSFREFLCGTGPLLVETALAAEERFNVPVRHLYGLSETTAVVTMMPQMPASRRRHWHRDYGFPSIGQALQHAHVAVLDAAGAEVEAARRGELAVRGAMIMKEYAGKPAETAGALRGGWFHTGDEGFWQAEEDGAPYFFITGRLKEIIIRGGMNISPFEIDAAICSHPGVRHGMAIPFDNRFYGEEIAAYVVPNGEVSEDEILAHCARYLDHAMCPKVVLFGSEVPYTSTGKAKRLELKRLLAPELERHRSSQFRRSRVRNDGQGLL